MEESIPLPPWSVAGTTVDIIKNPTKKTITITVPPQCMERLTDEQILELINFCTIVKRRLEGVLPKDWKVEG